MVFLELLVLVTVEFVFFQVHIFDVVFLILKVTFLEKFCLLCNLISYLNIYHSDVLFISDSSCNRVLSVSCGFSFPLIRSAFF